MLNAELVENFHGIFRQKQTGSLTVSGDEFNMRFYFQAGEVMAMDLGEDKEHLLADKLKEYHRLDAAQHTQVFSTREKVQGTVAEIVRSLRLASDDEIAQSTRAMVEDALCGVFAADIRHLSFNNLQGMDSFNFERSAVRLRIPVETLLKTVDHRVTEIQEVHRAVKDWDVVFAFAEGGDGASALTDFEKHVLNFVDGHRSVEEIGTACRDSSLNLARVLNGLAKKGVVRKLNSRNDAVTRSSASISPDPGPGDESEAVAVLPGDEPRVSARVAPRSLGQIASSSAPTAPSLVALPAAAVDPQQRFEMLPMRPEDRGLPWLRIVLVLTLCVVLVLGYFVYQSSQREKAFKQKQDEMADLVRDREWTAGLSKLDDLDKAAGTDLSEKQEVDELRTEFQAAIDAEYKKITKLIGDEDFGAANQLLVRLPEDATKDTTSTQLHSTEDEFNTTSSRLANDVSTDLDNGDIGSANTVISSNPAKVAANAALVRDRWRIRKLEEASASTTSIEDRQKALKQVRDASPADSPLTPNQAKSFTDIEADIGRQEGRLATEIKNLQEMADRGDYDTALAKAKELGTANVVKGNAQLMAAFATFQTTCDRIKGEFEQFSDDLRVAITSAETIDPLTKLYVRGADLLKTYPAASSHVATEGMVADLKEIIDAFSQPADVQSTVINQLLDGKTIDPDIQTALKTRLTHLNSAESEASDELENARGLAKEDNWDAAERIYIDIQHHPEWANTAARKAADIEVVDGRTEQERITTAKSELAKAISAGDIDKATEIARIVGQKFLPLVVESQPLGAEVWHGGKKLGVTPLVLDVPIPDRVDYNVEVRMDGYLTKTLVGSNALGGWRLVGSLERTAASQVDLGGPVSAHPVVIGQRIWEASRTAAYALSASGAIETYVFQGASGPEPLNEPVYGAASAGTTGVYIPSRENVALHVTKTADRVPLGAATDFAIAIYESPELLDSRFLIVAGSDGALHGVVEARPSQRWDATAGSPFAAGPVVIGEQVLAVHATGEVEVLRAYDGKKIGSDAIGEPVIAAWPTATGFSGLTANQSWDWDGKDITKAALPQGAVAGSAGCFVGISGRVWLKSGDDWKDLGHLDGSPTGEPLAWQGHVAVPMGTSVHVVGPRGFSATADTDFLAPVAVGKRLILISQDGKVQIYTP